MSLYLPPQWRWLAWVAGTTWPDGDEDRMWSDAAAWKTASDAVREQLGDVDDARNATLAAYPSGDGAAEMTAMFNGLHDGDGSVKQLADYLDQIHESCFDMGTELQDTKLTIILSLAWLALEIAWALAFPPTAAAVEAAAISSTRSALRLLEDAALDRVKALAGKFGAYSGKGRLFWKSVARGEFVLPSAKGVASYSIKLAEGAATSFGMDAAVQLGQMAAGKRRSFNWAEAGLSVLGSTAGTIPSREFARYLGMGIDNLVGHSLANGFGRTARAAVIGASAGAVSSVFGNTAVGLATGNFSSLNNPSSWVGGIARGAIAAGARGAAVKTTPISPGDIRYNLWGMGRSELKYLPTDGSATDVPGGRLPKAPAATEPVTESVTESVTEPGTEPVTESVTEPVTESVTEPVTGQIQGGPPENGSVNSSNYTESQPDSASMNSNHASGGVDPESVNSAEGTYENTHGAGYNESDLQSVHSSDSGFTNLGRSSVSSSRNPNLESVYSAGSVQEAGGANPDSTSGSIHGEPRPNSGSIGAGVGAGDDRAANLSARGGGSERADSFAESDGDGEMVRGRPGDGGHEESEVRDALQPGRMYPTKELPDQSAFLGKGTDMKSKTRPKREPEWEKPPEDYEAKSAPEEPFWVPDIPWTPPAGGGHHHHHHRPPHKHPPNP